jgi:Response regulator containing CheY-like receiver domain and AraC-type DNA-binding domain
MVSLYLLILENRPCIAGGTSAVSALHAWFGNLLSGVMKFAIEQRIDLNKHMKEDVFFRLYSYEFIEDKKRYLLDVCRVIISELHTDQSRKNETAEWIIEYIGKNYDKPLSLGLLADKISMSPSYLSALIKSHLGIGFVEYVSQLRIQKAVRLLEDDTLSVQEIAEQCGYDTIHTFIRQFKKTHRMPPNEYRKIRKRELGKQEIL